MTEEKNAMIIGTMLGREDHDIMTAYVELEYDSGRQSFGGNAFDEWDAAGKRRIGQAFGMEFICRLLTAVGVDSWEKLRGQPCRVRVDSYRIRAIGHYIKDNWFEPEVLRKEFWPE